MAKDHSQTLYLSGQWMDRQIHHHCVGHVLSGFDGSFGQTILGVITKPRDTVALVCSMDCITTL